MNILMNLIKQTSREMIGLYLRSLVALSLLNVCQEVINLNLEGVNCGDASETGRCR